jgi:Nif-specific regulatory protein
MEHFSIRRTAKSERPPGLPLSIEAGKLEGLAIPAGAGIAGVVLRSGMTASIREAKDEPHHYEAVDAHTGYHTSTLLALPIRQGSAICGVLELMNPFGVRAFAPWHRRAAQVVADVLSR